MTTQEMIQQTADYFKTQPVLKVWLFGSYLRGEDSEMSGVNLLVQFEHSASLGFFAYTRMHRELMARLSRHIDLAPCGLSSPPLLGET